MANVVAIPISVLSAILLVRMGRMADAGQIAMSDPVMSTASLLLWAMMGMGAIWMAASLLIQTRRWAMARRGEKGEFKTCVGMAAFFVILVVLALFTPLWMAGLAAVALYLFVFSSKALITNLPSGG
jgi:hypothetical protein